MLKRLTGILSILYPSGNIKQLQSFLSKIESTIHLIVKMHKVLTKTFFPSFVL